MTKPAENMPFHGGERGIPGNKAIWVGIYIELTEFALMFIVYFVARAHNPDAFGAGAQRLSTLAGMANTVIMLTSSYFVARSIWAIRSARGSSCLRWLSAALVTGLGYPLVKFFKVRWLLAALGMGLLFLLMKGGEYAHHFGEGVTLSTNTFYMFYLSLTFFHFMHVILGQDIWSGFSLDLWEDRSLNGVNMIGYANRSWPWL